MPAAEGPLKGPLIYTFQRSNKIIILYMFFAWQETMTSEGYSSPAQCLKYTKAGLGIPGENIINDVPFLKRFWLEKKLNFTN